MIYNFKKLLTMLFICITGISFAQDLSLSAGADVVSRYIWRGINVNDAINIQPALSLSVSGFSVGFWGSYSLSNNSSENIYGQELDTWLGYSYAFENGMSIGAIVTDYYFANAGIKWGNFNNYDDPEGPGAHTIETGLLLRGPDSFPISLSGFINVYNDAGSNTYFQVDYPATVGDVPLNFFVGASAGSEENPGYYGTETFNVINVGVKATKSVKITEDYSLPVSVTFLINPRAEISYLVFGLTF
ncbi:MAG TPA: hypothetical protein DHV28_12190 [Ignavibacteriales bacterium]|nr:hypothetical protein [Ignavibacteriales bacterium]